MKPQNFRGEGQHVLEFRAPRGAAPLKRGEFVRRCGACSQFRAPRGAAPLKREIFLRAARLCIGNSAPPGARPR